MRKKLLASAGLLLAGMWTGPVLAQEPPTASAPTTLEDVIVTAERRAVSIQKSSLAIEVLSATAIRDAGVSQIRDISTLTPGVVVGQGGHNTQMYIRGIGDFGSVPNSNPAIATYIDGVYVARGNALEGNFFDLSRVEVVKGPQGTLYGRNSAGGALNILTNAPVMGSRFGSLHVELGDYSAVNVDGMYNVPLGDDLAMRAAFQIVRRDGYASMGFDDDKKESGRLSVLWKPADHISLKVIGAYTHVGGLGPGYLFDTNNFPQAVATQLGQLSGAGLPAGGVQVPTDPRISLTDPRVWNVFWGIERLTVGQGRGGPGEVGPFNGVVSPPYCLAAAAANGTRINGVVTPLTFQNPGLCAALSNGVALPAVPGGYVAGWDPSRWQAFAHTNNRYWNLNAELNWDLGFANLTVIPAYRRTDVDNTTFPTTAFDGGGRAPEVSESKSLEVRLARDTSLVNWVVGAYYFNERQVQNSGSEPGVLKTGYLFNTWNLTHLRTDNYAVFGQGVWHLGDKFRLITGLRYSQETKHNSGLNVAVFPSIEFVFACNNSPKTDCITDAWDGQIKFHATNWKLGFEYDLTPDNMLYATAATGFKAGGLNTRSFNYPVDTTPIPFQPEKLTAYELGSRNRFFDDRLQINVEGFYWEYQGHQENATFVNSNGRLLSALVNAGAATTYGADVDVVARLTTNDRLRFNAQYNHSEYTDFNFIASGLIQGVDTDCRVTPIAGSATGQRVNCAGFPLSQAPLWSGSVSYSHRFELSNGGELEASVSGQYASRRYLSNFFNEQVRAPSYFVANFNATYSPPDGRWKLGVFGRNLTDEIVYSGAFSLRGANHTIQAVNVGAPRTFGVRFGIDF